MTMSTAEYRRLSDEAGQLVSAHGHRGIGDCGACPECRAYNIKLLADGAYVFACVHFTTDPNQPEAISVVRAYAPDGASEAAWATGCNLGIGLGFQQLHRADDIDRAGVPWFTLIRQPEANAAIAALGGPWWDGTPHPCSCCDEPMDVGFHRHN